MVRNGHKALPDEKKKHSDTLSDTIKRNYMKTTQNSKEIKEQQTAGSKDHALSEGGPLGSFAKKIAKVVKGRKENDIVTPPPATQIGDRKNTPSESERRKKVNGGFQQNANHKILEHNESKKLTNVPSRKLLQTESISSQAIREPKNYPSHGLSRDREKSRPREKSQEERKSQDDQRKRAKSKGKKRIKVMSQMESEKIKENLMKLNTKTKLIVLKNIQGRGVIKRFTRPRRSKSSKDILSDQLVKRVMGRSDSVNSKTQNEDQLYQEYRNLMGREKKGASQRDATFKEKIMKKNQTKVKLVLSRPASRSGKPKVSKLNKMYPRPNSFPVKVKKIMGPNSVIQSHPGKEMKEASPSERKKDKDSILEKIQQMNGKLQRNYDSQMNNKLKTTNIGLVLHQNHPKNEKKRSRKTPIQKKRNSGDDFGEEIPSDEQFLIDKEILQPKLSSEYNSNDPHLKFQNQNQYDSTHSKHLENLPSSKKNKIEPSSDEKGSIKDNGTPSKSVNDKSLSIHDSISSDQRNSNELKSNQDIDDLKKSTKMNPIDLSSLNTDPLSKDNLDKWMYLLNEFKKCEKNHIVDDQLRDHLMNFCDQTQKGLNILFRNKPETEPNSSRLLSPNQNEDSRKRKKPKMVIDVESINENFTKENTNTNIMVKENRSNSFQWLRAEFEQNLEELSKLLGSNNKEDTLKEIQDAIKINEVYSHVFELRISAIQDRYEAQKQQIEEIKELESTENKKSDLLEQLDEWYKAEIASMDSEKRKITKGWFTSIEAIRKIKRDIEITSDTKKTFGGISKGTGLNRNDDPANIYNIISKSLASPSQRRREKEKKNGKDHSPLSSPNGNSGFSHSKIISDPNIHSMKIKQANALRKNEELAKSIDHLDQSSRMRETPIDHQPKDLEISDNKLRIVDEIDEGLKQKPRDEHVDIIKHSFPYREMNPLLGYGSPLNPSMNSSGLYNISPTSMKHPSKMNSSNKPRSTLKNESAGDEKSKTDDLIWIKDQGRNSTRYEKVPPISMVSPNQIAQNLSVPPSSTKEDRNEPLSSHSQPGLHHIPFTPTLTLNNQQAYDSTKKEEGGLNSGSDLPKKSSAKGAQNEPEDYINDLIQGIGFDSQMIKNDFEDKDGKGSHYGLDDFASMSDSDREVSRKFNIASERRLGVQSHQLSTKGLSEDISEKRMKAILESRSNLSANVNVVSDQILDLIFTETITDIIQMLESENMDLEHEISHGNSHQIFHQDLNINDGIMSNIHMGDSTVRRGIRVNSNAIKEYLSLLTNYIKGKQRL